MEGVSRTIQNITWSWSFALLYMLQTRVMEDVEQPGVLWSRYYHNISNPVLLNLVKCHHFQAPRVLTSLPSGLTPGTRAQTAWRWVSPSLSKKGKDQMMLSWESTALTESDDKAEDHNLFLFTTSSLIMKSPRCHKCGAKPAALQGPTLL